MYHVARLFRQKDKQNPCRTKHFIFKLCNRLQTDKELTKKRLILLFFTFLCSVIGLFLCKSISSVRNRRCSIVCSLSKGNFYFTFISNVKKCHVSKRGDVDILFFALHVYTYIAISYLRNTSLHSTIVHQITSLHHQCIVTIQATVCIQTTYVIQC